MKLKALFVLLFCFGFISCEGDADPVDEADAASDDDDNNDVADDDDDATDDDDDNDNDNDAVDDDDDNDAVDDDDNNDAAADDDDNDSVAECIAGEYPEGPYGWKVGSTVQNHIFDDCNGGEVQLSDYQGDKIIWLVLSSMWCPSCDAEGRKLDQVYEDNKDQIQIIYVLGEAVNPGSGTISVEDCKGYGDYKDHDFPMVRDEGYKQTSGYFSLSGGIPLNILIDKCMRIRVKEEGWGEGAEEDWDLYIEMLLEEEN